MFFYNQEKSYYKQFSAVSANIFVEFALKTGQQQLLSFQVTLGYSESPDLLQRGPRTKKPLSILLKM
jgi:hypothetical protein